jgi:hypothetical protein
MIRDRAARNDIDVEWSDLRGRDSPIGTEVLGTAHRRVGCFAL